MFKRLLVLIFLLCWSGFSWYRPGMHIPELFKPVDGSVCLNPARGQLGWTGDPDEFDYIDPLYYHVNISGTEYGTGTWDTLIVKQGHSYYWLQLDGLNNLDPGTYTWKVRTEVHKNLGDRDYGDWSATWTFSIAPIPEQAFPVDHSTELGTSVELSWHPLETCGSGYNISYKSEWDDYYTGLPEVTDTSFTLRGLLGNTVYYWKVGRVRYSTVWQFKTKRVTPSVPVLISVGNNVLIGEERRLQLEWFHVYDADSIRSQISTTEDFSDIVHDTIFVQDWEGLTSYFERSRISSLFMDYNTTYYWRLNASNVAGTSDWSEVRSFTTVIPPPDTPSLVSPLDGLIDQPLTQTLIWRVDSTTDSCRLQVANVSDFSTTIIDDSTITDTFYILNDLTKDTRYYWRVSSSNICGYSEWSEVRDFKTIPEVPLSPMVLSPLDGDDNISIDTVLIWSSIDGVISYGLQVSTDSTFSDTLVSVSLSDTFYSVSDLENSRVYYWRLNATNIGGTGDWSSVSKFRTIMAIPEVPTLLSPENGVINQSISTIFRWGSVDSCDRYTYEVSDEEDFSSIVASFNLKDTIDTIPDERFSNNVTYYWRVRAHNFAGDGNWSDIFSFKTIPSRPDDPVIVYPGYNSDDIPVDISVVWHSVDGADSYLLFICTVITDTIVYARVTDTCYPVSLDYSNHYNILLNAENIVGLSNQDDFWDFHTMDTLPLPETPNLSDPFNQSTGVSINSQLSWEGSGNYQVQISESSDFSSLYLDTYTGHNYLYTNLEEYTLYYWRVRSFNEIGTSNWSSSWSFTTDLSYPAPVELLDPLFNTDTVTLRWQSSSPLVFEYQVEVGGLFDSIVSGTELEITGLGSGSYSWSVRAHNHKGWSSLSDASFVVSLPLPSVTLDDIDTSEKSQIELSWTSSSADEYRVQLFYDKNRTHIMSDSILVDTCLLVRYLSNGTYYWQVQGRNGYGWGDFTVSSFVIDVPAVSVITIPVTGIRSLSGERFYDIRGRFCGSSCSKGNYIVHRDNRIRKILVIRDY